MEDAAWEFQHSVECKAAKSFAWLFWTDVSNWERLEGKAVEWIKIHGPFAAGTTGETKMPGQPIQPWTITQLDPEHFARIELPVAGAIFVNEMRMVALSSERIQIIQRLSLVGAKAQELAGAMGMFETSAPQGLAKLARTIEHAFLDQD